MVIATGSAPNKTLSEPQIFAARFLMPIKTINGSSRTSTPTIKKDDRRMCDGDPYVLGSRRQRSPCELCKFAYGKHWGADPYRRDINRRATTDGCIAATDIASDLFCKPKQNGCSFEQPFKF